MAPPQSAEVPSWKPSLRPSAYTAAANDPTKSFRPLQRSSNPKGSKGSYKGSKSEDSDRSKGSYKGSKSSKGSSKSEDTDGYFDSRGFNAGRGRGGKSQGKAALDSSEASNTVTDSVAAEERAQRWLSKGRARNSKNAEDDDGYSKSSDRGRGGKSRGKGASDASEASIGKGKGSKSQGKGAADGKGRGKGPSKSLEHSDGGTDAVAAEERAQRWEAKGRVRTKQQADVGKGQATETAPAVRAPAMKSPAAGDSPKGKSKNEKWQAAVEQQKDTVSPVKESRKGKSKSKYVVKDS